MDTTPPPKVYGRYESILGHEDLVKKTSRGRDPGWVDPTATRDISDLNDVKNKIDPVTGNYVPRENMAATPIDPGGPRSLVNRGKGNSKIGPGGTLPKNAVEFATLQDEYVKIPTNTTDYNRPRTVAAAWDPSLATMTVIFRDSTFYNYYKVNKDEWNTFKNHHSPGEYIIETLNNKPRGPADVDNIIALYGDDALKQATELARKAQLREAHKKKFKPTPRNTRKSKSPFTPPSKGRGTFQPTTFDFGDL